MFDATLRWEKAAQGVGSGYVPHIRATLHGRKHNGLEGWLHEFNSPRLRFLPTQEPWLDEARLARLRRRAYRWAKRHGHNIAREVYHLEQDDPVHEWYIDVA